MGWQNVYQGVPSDINLESKQNNVVGDKPKSRWSCCSNDICPWTHKWDFANNLFTREGLNKLPLNYRHIKNKMVNIKLLPQNMGFFL